MLKQNINGAMKVSVATEEAKGQFSEIAEELLTKQFAASTQDKKSIKITDYIDNLVSLDETGSIASKANSVFKRYSLKEVDYSGRITVAKSDGDFSKSFTENNTPCVVNSCVGSFIEPFECDNNIWNSLFTPTEVPYCINQRISVPFSGRVFETAPIVADGDVAPAMSSSTPNGCIEVVAERRAKSDFILRSQICNPNVCFDLLAQKQRNMLNLQKNTNNDISVTFVTTNGANVNTTATANINEALDMLKYKIVKDSPNDDGIIMVADRLVVMKLLDEVDDDSRPINPNEIPCDNNCPVVCYRGKYIIGVNHPSLKPVTVAGVTTALVLAGQKTSGMFIYSTDNLSECSECDGRERLRMFNSFIAEAVVPTYLRPSYAFTSLVL